MTTEKKDLVDFLKKENEKQSKGKAMIHTFPPFQYQGQQVYIRWISGIWVWEYFVLMDNMIYTAHNIIAPRWHRRWHKRPYTQRQLMAAYYTLQKMSETTIEIVKDKK